jgi:hypothetical protein
MMISRVKKERGGKKRNREQKKKLRTEEQEQEITNARGEDLIARETEYEV